MEIHPPINVATKSHQDTLEETWKNTRNCIFSIYLHSQKKLSYMSIIIELETPVGVIEEGVVVCLFIDVARTQKPSVGNL